MKLLEDDVVVFLANQISKEIDQEVLWSIRVVDCKEKGWTLVNIDRYTDNNHAVDITHWIDENIKGQFHRNGAHFIFEDSKDAFLFTLRWS